MATPRTVCLNIVVVGSVEVTDKLDEQLSAMIGRIEQGMHEVFPSFEPAHPPVTMIVAELPLQKKVSNERVDGSQSG